MSYMFREAESFNQNIGIWDVSNVLDFRYMFRDAITFDQDIGDWDISTLQFAWGMFRGATLSTVNYDSLLIGWQGNLHNSNVYFDGGNSTYCEGETARNGLLVNSWNISDRGKDIACSSFPFNPYFDDGIQDLVKVFPNPSDGFINLVTNEDLDISIYSITGQKVYYRKFYKGTSNKIDLSNFSSGVYFINYLSEGIQVNKKIIISSN